MNNISYILAIFGTTISFSLTISLAYGIEYGYTTENGVITKHIIENQNSGFMQTRYTIECGLPANINPELWMQYTAAQYNYDTNQMPEDVRNQFNCASVVKAQEGADELFSGLGDAMRNEHKNN